MRSMVEGATTARFGLRFVQGEGRTGRRLWFAPLHRLRRSPSPVNGGGLKGACGCDDVKEREHDNAV